MKKFAQNIILLIAAVTVFLTGMGVTVVNFCCTNCAEQTLFITNAHTCCSEKVTSNNKSCCSAEKNTENNSTCNCTDETHCKASRISVDIDTPMFRTLVVNPFEWIADTNLFLPLSILAENIESTDIYVRFESPPKIPPRDYLSFIKVLII